MSKNDQKNNQLKMRSKLEAKSKNSGTISSNVKKSTANAIETSKKIDVTKKEEKAKSLLKKKVVDVSSSEQPVNKGAIKKQDAKASVSVAAFSNINKTLKPQHHNVATKPKHITTIKQISSSSSVMASKKIKSGKNNLVMNSIHNVTVSSPPSKRKQPIMQEITEKEKPLTHSKRYFSTEETKISKSEATNLHVEQNRSVSEDYLKVKDSVSFEVFFDKAQKTISNVQPKNVDKNQNNSDEGEYDDDFESYESDFETGSSSEVLSQSCNSSRAYSLDDRESPPDEGSGTDQEFKSEAEEESEPTHIPITVIHKEKELERKLDSGNYDLNSKHRAQEFLDSFDELLNCEQLDSGISYENNISVKSFETDSASYGGFRQFFTRPKTSKRGTEIMLKVQFDIVSITLFELKPFPYDIYMRMFGNSFTTQNSSQTLDNLMEGECQTDACEMRSVQIQHPPLVDMISSENFYEPLNGVTDMRIEDENVFVNTIHNISKLRHKKNSTEMKYNLNKPLNLERLNTFISNSALIISQILTKNSQSIIMDLKNLSNISKGFIKLNTDLLNALRVIRVFGNAKFNLIMTVHESIENVYHNDFLNLIMVWNSQDATRPMRLLSTWSEVSRAEICNDSPEIIVCGLKDGSVAMWDMRETYSVCSKLDGHLTHFAATSLVAPSLRGDNIQSFDLGAVVDVRSFRSALKTFTHGNKFNSVQFAALNETGILTIWTLVETNITYETSSSISDSKFEYISPWARVKLIQSAICNLREYIDQKTIFHKSTFENTKSNFEKDVFSDRTLKELAETQNDIRLSIQGLRFINLDCGKEFIFVGINRNFIISCSKSLKKERFRKINIVECGFLFPTAIKLLPNENYLAVGLSNGSTMILNCNQNTTKPKYLTKFSRKHKKEDSSRSDSIEFDLDIGKSCAIQNIIRNERRLLNNYFLNDEFRPNTAHSTSASLEEGKKPYELKIFDEKVLLSGSVFRKDLVQSLEFSNDGWLLFTLSDGNVRIYDFFTESEMQFNESTVLNGNIIDIASSRHGDDKTIIVLNNDNSVQVQLLK